MSEPRSFLDGRVTLFAGDCRDVLKGMADNSIDSVVCDPPYHLTSIVKRFSKENPEDVERNFVSRKIEGQGASPFARAARGFMGKSWDGGDIAFQIKLWAEVLRVLKPGGYIMAFSGCRTYHRMACAIEDAGFITHPFFAWTFSSGFPKAHNLSKQLDKMAGYWRGRCGDITIEDQPCKGTEYERTPLGEPITDAAREWDGWFYGTQSLAPSLEPIYFGQKPFSEKTGAANVLKHGVGAVNISTCKIQGETLIDRWPKNLIHDGSPEVLSCFPEVNGYNASRYFASFPRESEESVCSENVSNVGNNFMQDHPRLQEEMGDFAQENVGMSTTQNQKENGQQRDILTSAEIAGTASGEKMEVGSSTTNLSIGGCGNENTDLSKTGMKSTISTTIAQTIESRISLSSKQKIITPITSASERTTERAMMKPLSDNVLDVSSGNVLNCSIQEKPEHLTDIANNVSENIFLNGGNETEATTKNIKNDIGSIKRIIYHPKANQDSRLGSRHPTIKPLALIQELARLITPRNGLCLDLFAGSGTTAEACFREGFRSILIENDSESIADIERRMSLVMEGPVTRANAGMKARGRPRDDGPLFGGSEERPRIYKGGANTSFDQKDHKAEWLRRHKNSNEIDLLDVKIELAKIAVSTGCDIEVKLTKPNDDEAAR